MDAEFMSSHSIDMKTWVKASCAPSQRKCNASSAAKGYSDPFELLSEVQGPAAPAAPHLDVWWGDSHTGVCEDVKTWVDGLLDDLLDDNEIRALINSPIPPKYSENSLWTTGRKNPDVSVLLNCDCLALQIEVDSCTRDDTVFKLKLGLIDQHRSEKNYNSAIQSCSGLYFPVGDGFIEHVKCEWLDKELKYCFECTNMTRLAAEDVVRDAVCEAMERYDNRNECTQFTIPMSELYIHTCFGPSAFQLSSSESIVIMDPLHNLVYKRALRGSSRDRLLELATSTLHLDHTALPRMPNVSINSNYFVYTAYRPTLMKEHLTATRDLKLFVATVTSAIRELHIGEIAHLDIRMENICFNSNWEAVLVDVDRSRHTLDKANDLFVLYSRGSMYAVPAAWTCEQLDWKQFGLLIEELTELPHVFIDKLKNFGGLHIL